jgi:hypothetical protein
MEWNGIIGSVASVINTALPFFFGLLGNESSKEIKSVPIGPATLFNNGGTLKLGNFDVTHNPSGAPVMINFTTPE